MSELWDGGNVILRALAPLIPVHYDHRFARQRLDIWRVKGWLMRATKLTVGRMRLSDDECLLLYYADTPHGEGTTVQEMCGLKSPTKKRSIREMAGATKAYERLVKRGLARVVAHGGQHPYTRRRYQTTALGKRAAKIYLQELSSTLEDVKAAVGTFPRLAQ